MLEPQAVAFVELSIGKSNIVLDAVKYSSKQSKRLSVHIESNAASSYLRNPA